MVDHDLINTCKKKKEVEGAPKCSIFQMWKLGPDM